MRKQPEQQFGQEFGCYDPGRKLLVCMYFVHTLDGRSRHLESRISKSVILFKEKDFFCRTPHQLSNKPHTMYSFLHREPPPVMSQVHYGTLLASCAPEDSPGTLCAHIWFRCQFCCYLHRYLFIKATSYDLQIWICLPTLSKCL
jgi:hypothetical protein